MRVVLVDDNAMNVTVVQEMLKRAGYRNLSSCSSAVELYKLLGVSEDGTDLKPAYEEPDVDLILLDMMMPRIDGITACRTILGLERLKDIPIIMVTAIGDSKKLAEALDAGASDYVTKPINRVELMARIRSALRLKQQKNWHRERDRRLRDELRLAREVQYAVLPQRLENEQIVIDAIYRPSEELSGDLYAWHRIDENRYAVAVIDAMGHGISSSLVCMFIASVLKEVMSKLFDPEDVVRELNRRAMQLHFSDQLIQYYFTGIYMVIDMERGVAEYVNAGHPPGLLLRSSSGEVEPFTGGSPAIGLFEGITVNKQSLRLAPGDRIVIVTDGLLDRTDDAEEDPIERLGMKLTSGGLEDYNRFPDDWREALFGEPIDGRGRSDDQCLLWIALK
ncbi:fused response regulator/phosphatase [Paenibacillus sp. PR3]|uniref:Fused response regulator/phosphatase n=1 Tax=Paenibacillus terricola TaxID=2763503 RepID=A0ABR8N805_9BACL|nr:fused response regulator/phosphatase [Paenibacillus terricola]MBD3922579.1 fused response regulator/phosphatase [Paenibacillus terricola]